MDKTMANQNKPAESKSDEQVWDELLNSKEGSAALDSLMEDMEMDVENGDITEDK